MHLHQPRHRPFKFEGPGAGGVQVGWRRRRADHHLDLAVVERVDQGHEAARLVAARFVETGHPVDYHGVKAVGDSEIITRPERHLAKIGEGEAGDAGDRPRHRDGAALVGEVGGPRRQAVGQGGEGLIEMGRRRGVPQG